MNTLEDKMDKRLGTLGTCIIALEDKMDKRFIAFEDKMDTRIGRMEGVQITQQKAS